MKKSRAYHLYEYVIGSVFRVRLTESCGFAPKLKVDRKRDVIHGVKILGFVSKNGRRYTEGACKRAVALYEGKFVNVDHPEKHPGQSRSSYDRFGVLKNIRYVEGKGLYGDLHYYRTHKLTPTILEDVEKGLGGFGLSHNASGDGERDKDGTLVVTEITDVRHVDLVADPATTFSLSESVKEKGKRQPGGPPAWRRLHLRVHGGPPHPAEFIPDDGRGHDDPEPTPTVSKRRLMPHVAHGEQKTNRQAKLKKARRYLTKTVRKHEGPKTKHRMPHGVGADYLMDKGVHERHPAVRILRAAHERQMRGQTESVSLAARLLRSALVESTDRISRSELVSILTAN